MTKKERNDILFCRPEFISGSFFLKTKEEISDQVRNDMIEIKAEIATGTTCHLPKARKELRNGSGAVGLPQGLKAHLIKARKGLHSGFFLVSSYVLKIVFVSSALYYLCLLAFWEW